MKKILSIVLVLALCIALLPLSASATTNITRVNLTLEYPVAGKTAYTTAAINGNGYSVYSIEWYDRTDSRFLDTGEKFQADHQYKATVWVEAKEGYQFSHADDNTPAIGGYINGEEVEVTKAFEYKAWAMVCLTYYFPSTPTNGWIRTVDLTIPAPQAGAKPSYPQFEHTAYKFTNMVALPEYVNGINWTNVTTDKNIDPNTTFQAGAQYSVNITIEQKSGYAFVPQPVVKVNGQTASASLDYGTVLFVKATFPILEDNHTHTPSDWRTTGAYHYKACTECGDFLEQEDHTGGTATCTKGGKCTVCGYEYIEPNGHKWSPTYLYQTETGHAWICADCKEHSEIIPHEAGPAGTPGADVVCKDCGYVMSETEDTTPTTPAATEEPVPETPPATDAPSAPGKEDNTPPSNEKDPQKDWLLYVFIGSTGILLLLLIALLCKKKKVNNTNRKDETQ